MKREEKLLSDTGKTALKDEELGKVTGGVDESEETPELSAEELIRQLDEANQAIGKQQTEREESMPQIGTAEHAGTGGAAVMQGTFTGTNPFRP